LRSNKFAINVGMEFKGSDGRLSALEFISLSKKCLIKPNSNCR
jgi:hypothetical protein